MNITSYTCPIRFQNTGFCDWHGQTVLRTRKKKMFWVPDASVMKIYREKALKNMQYAYLVENKHFNIKLPTLCGRKRSKQNQQQANNIGLDQACTRSTLNLRDNQTQTDQPIEVRFKIGNQHTRTFQIVKKSALYTVCDHTELCSSSLPALTKHHDGPRQLRVKKNLRVKDQIRNLNIVLNHETNKVYKQAGSSADKCQHQHFNLKNEEKSFTWSNFENILNRKLPNNPPVTPLSSYALND
jgi:hypothetical protein